MAENARPGIPAGIGLHAGIDRHGNPVFLPVIERVSEIHRKGRISVVMTSQQTSVYRYGRVHHHTVKVEINLLPLPLCRDVQLLRVSGHPLGVVPHGRPRRRVRAHVALDHIVVGKVYLPAETPRGQSHHQHGTSLLKRPASVQIFFLHFLPPRPIPGKHFPGSLFYVSNIKNPPPDDKDDFLLYNEMDGRFARFCILTEKGWKTLWIIGNWN